MKFNVVRFYGLSPKIDGPLIHSDTVFGAVCHAIVTLEGEAFLTEILKNMCEYPQKGFWVSSMYPFIKNDGRLVHLVPFELLNFSSKEKELKRKFVDISFFNHSDPLELPSFLYSPPKISYRARNRVGRVAEAEELTNTTLFSMPCLEMEMEEWGFWCGYAGDTKIVEEAFRFLEDEGIGGDRNILNTTRRVEFDRLDVLDSGEYFTNLSLYVPMEEELRYITTNVSTVSTNECWYKLVERGGWREVSGVGRQIKPARYYFAEGSVFRAIPKREIYGRFGEYSHLKGVFWSGITIPVFFNRAREVIASLQSE